MSPVEGLWLRGLLYVLWPFLRMVLIFRCTERLCSEILPDAQQSLAFSEMSIKGYLRTLLLRSVFRLLLLLGRLCGDGSFDLTWA